MRSKMKQNAIFFAMILLLLVFSSLVHSEENISLDEATNQALIQMNQIEHKNDSSISSWDVAILTFGFISLVFYLVLLRITWKAGQFKWFLVILFTGPLGGVVYLLFGLNRRDQ